MAQCPLHFRLSLQSQCKADEAESYLPKLLRNHVLHDAEMAMKLSWCLSD